MESAVMSQSQSTNSSNAEPVLPYEKRAQRIHYRNADGTMGEVAYPINYQELYNLKGRLLTLIDATYTDPQQRKAQKDIVWQTLQSWMHDIETAGDGEPFGITASGVTHHHDGDAQSVEAR